MKIYFATNRNGTSGGKNPTDYGRHFSEAGLDLLRVGTVTADTATDKKRRVVTFPETQRRGGSADLFSQLKSDMDSGADTLVYVHGYNVTFQEAVTSALEIKERYTARPLSVVLFSWPSDGSLMPWVAYRRDQRDAEASGPAFGRAFLKTRDFLQSIAPRQMCRRKLHLLCHSMGNHVLQFALRDIVEVAPDGLSRVFDQAILAAADVDANAFDRDYKLGRLPYVCSRVTVYFNRGDTALAISDATKGNPDRLGHDGPERPHQLPAKVVAVDCSEIAGAEHSYYLTNASVRIDIQETLAGKEPTDFTPQIKRVYTPHNNRYLLRKP